MNRIDTTLAAASVRRAQSRRRLFLSLRRAGFGLTVLGFAGLGLAGAVLSCRAWAQRRERSAAASVQPDDGAGTAPPNSTQPAASTRALTPIERLRTIRATLAEGTTTSFVQADVLYHAADLESLRVVAVTAPDDGLDPATGPAFLARLRGLGSDDRLVLYELAIALDGAREAGSYLGGPDERDPLLVATRAWDRGAGVPAGRHVDDLVALVDCRNRSRIGIAPGHRAYPIFRGVEHGVVQLLLAGGAPDEAARRVAVQTALALRPALLRARSLADALGLTVPPVAREQVAADPSNPPAAVAAFALPGPLPD